ncbi:WXG100 family type VII secretion target [Allocatelliglobosispora scoriae]|uniref:WXG100 family type VII secretion target n=1 Tax=Allocatelliglobosispora scoriae TaxID=643052 RepID=A0A841BK22_9ACTN|nr:WXG100 family type VII secretion target [Allocatelliglobosispora scoriae]MBB5867363.1 WXG100 family type VII secretion target [Allocatelliglobosispora scoriae]
MSTTPQNLERAAQRMRAEARRLHDIHADLRRTTRAMTWQGPAAERFERSVARREREIDEQRDLLDFLARRLDDAADAARALERKTP